MRTGWCLLATTEIAREQFSAVATATRYEPGNIGPLMETLLCAQRDLSVLTSTDRLEYAVATGTCDAHCVGISSYCWRDLGRC